MKHIRTMKPATISYSRERPFKYVSHFNSKGQRYYYFERKKGDKKQYFKSKPGTQEFLLEYNKFMGLLAEKPSRSKTNSDLILAFKETSYYKDLSDKTKATKGPILEWIRERIGHLSPKDMRPDHVEALMQKKEGAQAANRIRINLKQLFNLAQKKEWVPQGFNPAELADARKHKSKGFHTWTEEELAKFEECHGRGSQARLALYLFMATGASRIDGVQLGFKNIAEDGKIYLSRSKTKVGRGSTIPVFLAEELERLPKDDPCFLMTEYGRPFSEKAFGNKFKKWTTQAGIPQCTIHGLRKAIAVKLAASGANKHEIAAWLAHDGTQTVDVYTKDVERDRLIENAQKRLGWAPCNLK